jgi:two-component system OmpR family sensor kinase
MKTWSLQTRLALAIGVAVTVLWLLAALATAHQLSQRMNDVFDDGLQATAQRILPLALHDLRSHGEGDDDHEVGSLSDDDEKVVYVVRDAAGTVLLQSANASTINLPPFKAQGFQEDDGYRIYQQAMADGQVTISVAEPLTDRARLAQSMMLDLSLPLLLVIPLSLLAIALAINRGFLPLRALEQAISRRGAQDLSPLAVTDLPRELKPFAAEVNDLFSRLHNAFEAERSFAANAAHELRTPVAGAIAQAQRLKTETADANAARRAGEIETTLKRLMRTSEKLMQLARAEGGRMRQDRATDMRTALRVIVEDFRCSGAERCQLNMPDRPVPAVMEPDAFGILCRNLIENALRHGSPDAPVEIDLSPEAVLTVSNAGPLLPPEVLGRMSHRFQKGSDDSEGAGLGLAIVTAITERAGAEFSVVSPIPGRDSGVSARVALPRG